MAADTPEVRQSDRTENPPVAKRDRERSITGSFKNAVH